MDTTADACEDFYQYACGGWQKNNPIPDDQASWSVYGKLYDDNQRYLWGILTDLAASKNGTPEQRKLGDYFAACKDDKAVEQAGITPLQGSFAQIAGLKSKDDRSEEHTSEPVTNAHLVCRLPLDKKKVENNEEQSNT